MKEIKKLTFILSIISCLVMTFGGCSLALPEGDGGETTPPNVKTEFEDCYVGQMFVVYDKENNILTSQTMGDETCVAYAFKYDADAFEYGGEYKGIISNDISGADYITSSNNNTELLDGGSKYTDEITLYLNEDGYEDKVYAFDSLTYDENGGVISAPGIGHTGAFSNFKSKLEITQTITKTVNDSVEEKFLTFCVIMNVDVREVGTDWKILQYRDDGSLIKIDTVIVDTDENFQLDKDCTYVVYEETLKNGSKRREIKQIEHEDNYIHFYYDGGFGLLKTKAFNLIKANTGMETE